MILEKKTLNLREGDFTQIGLLFQSRGIAPSVAIRIIISQYVDEALKAQPGQDPKINIKL